MTGPTVSAPSRRRGGAFLGVGLAVSALRVAGIEGEVAVAFSLLMQAIWFIPTTLVGGPLALREVHRETARARSAAGASVPSPP